MENSLEEKNNEELQSNKPQITATPADLSQLIIDRLKTHQDLYYGIVGGALAALVGAVLWAVITVTFKYQIGFMAIGVGLLVGFAVRFFGAGIDKKFGTAGALLALFGCLLGNLFSQVGFIANAESIGYLETLSYLNLSEIIAIMKESFHPMDILFYGFAIYEGYRFSFRKLTAEQHYNMENGTYDGAPPFGRLKMPLIIVIIVLLFIFVFKIHRGVNGAKVYTYKSGAKMSEGELKKSLEHGAWTFYYEDGSVMTEAFFDMGVRDSTWHWYSENGALNTIGSYHKGIEHGTWIIYYENKIVSDSGNYINGRKNGLWISRYENGNIFTKGNYDNDIQTGKWKTFYENGQLLSAGLYDNGEHAGDWTLYFENGKTKEEMTYVNGGDIVIQNKWNTQGRQLVTGGEGTYSDFDENGQLIIEGTVKNGKRTGVWKSYFNSGNLKEEGEYDNNGIYRIINTWNEAGDKYIKDGFGIYFSNNPDSTAIYDTGEVKDGLRQGYWQTFNGYGVNIQKMNYNNGKLNGMMHILDSETGKTTFECNMKDGKPDGTCTQYYITGEKMSEVIFVNGKKEGIQTFWDESGRKQREEHYTAGALTGKKQ